MSQGFTNPECFQCFIDQAIDNLVNNLFRTPGADEGCKIPATIAIVPCVTWADEQMGYRTRSIDTYNVTILALMEWEQRSRKIKI